MGYYISTEGSDFFLSEEHKQKAYEALCLLNTTHHHLKRGGGIMENGTHAKWFSWLDADYPNEYSTLEALLEALGFDVQTQDGHIVGLSYDNKKGQEDLFLWALSPWVRDGSYIDWLGEDGSRWRYEFVNMTMFEREAVVIYKPTEGEGEQPWLSR